METGLASKNSLKFINVSLISQQLGRDLSRSLAGFHSFIGCNQIPAFAGKGKLKPLKVLKSNSSYQKAFASLGSSLTSEDVINQLKMFTCEVYGIKKNTDVDKRPTVNDARYQMFCDKYSSKKKKKLSLLEVKGIHGSNLPPCKSALEQQIKRAKMYLLSLESFSLFQIRNVFSGWKRMGIKSGRKRRIAILFKLV